MRGENITPISELGIVLGYKCGLRCRHCAVAGSRDNADVSHAEISLLKSAIRECSPKVVSFTGGEPTRYIPQINSILSAPAMKCVAGVRITTNGAFADTVGEAVKTLQAFTRLDSVQLSYDSFHKRSGALNRAQNVIQSCSRLCIKFKAVLTVESPLDLVLLNELKELGRFPVVVQKVLPVGAAVDNGIEYQYPVFDKSVLDQKCVNQGKMFYICGRGFSVCCSSLMFNNVPGEISHSTLREQLGSRFYKLITRKSISGLMRASKISAKNLRPRHSSPCTLCEMIFRENRWN